MLPCGSHSEQLKKLTELSAKLDERLKSQPCISNSEQLNKLTELSAKFDTKLESLPCGSHKQDLADHDKAVTRISTTLQYLEKTLEGLQKQNKTQIYTLSHSPLRITDAGREMMEKLGIQAMFDANWPRVKRFIDEMGNKNPYDIDQFCIQQAVVFPEKFLQADELDKIKIDAYKTGDTLMSYMKVFAVLARDRYFEENGINVAEEDYTPDPYCNNITRTQ